MGGLLGHRGHERHRGRAAADHDDALARVVEVLGPLLGVHDPAGEALGARELGRVALVVAVVAAAHEEEVAGEAHGPRRCRRARPPPSSARPCSTTRPARRGGWKRILALDPVLGRSRGRSRGSTGRRRSPSLRPGLERVAEGVHVGVRADAGVAEEVPGPPQVVARLEDGVGLRPGSASCRWQAAPMPESPAPTISTSRCSGDASGLGASEVMPRAPGEPRAPRVEGSWSRCGAWGVRARDPRPRDRDGRPSSQDYALLGHRQGRAETAAGAAAEGQPLIGSGFRSSQRSGRKAKGSG